MKDKAKVRLALLWHMHQPVYKLPEEQEFRLPWVRMHAMRGYLWLAQLAQKYAKVRQTINLVPCLLEQIEDYGRGRSDAVERLARVDAAALSDSDKRYLLEHFFSINPRHHIIPYPRYRQLLEDSRIDGGERALKKWPTAYWRDLQVWFHLSSLDAVSKQEHPLAVRLLAQGREFSETDKYALLDLYRQRLTEIIPLYKKLWHQGTIEISTTPYYHPILPILCDAGIGREANPALPEYDLNFCWPEDAVFQIQKALTAMEDWFGKRPLGMWPSEGSISAEVIGLLQDQGLSWCASDEEVLEKAWRASGADKGTLLRNRPYHLPKSSVAIFFRNHDLSDRLGFVYQNMPAADAVEDFIKAVLAHAGHGPQLPVVSVILDGENPWEHYPQGGRDFLDCLFSRLSDHPQIETVTFSQVCKEAVPLKVLLPGSWINGNFDIWIGDVMDRNAWRLVSATREQFMSCRNGLTESQCQDVMDLILRAQGSDWYWWYGSEHPTKDLLIFDSLLRDHLLRAFEIMSKEPPSALLSPVSASLPGRTPQLAVQTHFIEPRIDLRPSPFFEWAGAGSLEAQSVGGSMHQVSQKLTVMFGFSRQGNLYLRCPLPSGGKDLPIIRVTTPKAEWEISATDRVFSEGELTARIELSPLPIFPAYMLTVHIGWGEKSYVFTLSSPHPSEIASHWLV